MLVAHYLLFNVAPLFTNYCPPLSMFLQPSRLLSLRLCFHIKARRVTVQRWSRRQFGSDKRLHWPPSSALSNRVRVFPCQQQFPSPPDISAAMIRHLLAAQMSTERVSIKSGFENIPKVGHFWPKDKLPHFAFIYCGVFKKCSLPTFWGIHTLEQKCSQRVILYIFYQWHLKPMNTQCFIKN